MAVATRVLGAAAALSALTCAGLVLGADSVASLFSSSAAARSEMAALPRLGAAYVPLVALAEVLRSSALSVRPRGASGLVAKVAPQAVRFVLGAGALLAGLGLGGAVVTLVLGAALGLVVATQRSRGAFAAWGPALN